MFRFSLVGVAVLAVSSVAYAHPGPRIFLGNEGGRVTTYLGNNLDASTSFVQARIFTQGLENPAAGVYTNSFPGYQVAEGLGVSVGTTFGFDIAGPLYYFDDYSSAAGTGLFVPVAEAFAGGTVPQLAVSKTTLLVTTGAGATAGFSFFPYTGAGAHSHNTYTLFGDGVSASDGPSGVYALPMTVNGTGLATSETFYLLLGKDVGLGTAEFDAAVVAANAQFIPEPGAAVWVAPALLLLKRRRRVTAR